MDGIRILVKVRQEKRASKRSAYYPVGLIACKRQYASHVRAGANGRDNPTPGNSDLKF